MRIETLQHQLREAGAKPVHAARVLRAWLQAQPLDRERSSAQASLPRTLKAFLPRLGTQLGDLLRLHSRHADAAGAERLLLALSDGQTIESVLLPRGGVCVSTQVGCAVGCTFCMTGRDGLLRQLGSAEIVAQVVLARGLRPVKKVVFMGMGEPAHNLDNVLDAIDLLGTHGAIGHKNLVFSTVGDRRAFDRLRQGRVKPALAVSLHATDQARRAELLPRAPAIPPDELVALADAYGRSTGYPVQYQWTLIAGVNDGDAEIESLGRLLAGRYGLMNFIPYNPAGGATLTRPTVDRMTHLAEILRRHGVLVKFRQSAGQVIEGGCGQLRARTLATEGGGESSILAPVSVRQGEEHGGA